jgi:hypothetical protein
MTTDLHDPMEDELRRALRAYVTTGDAVAPDEVDLARRVRVERQRRSGARIVGAAAATLLVGGAAMVWASRPDGTTVSPIGTTVSPIGTTKEPVATTTAPPDQPSVSPTTTIRVGPPRLTGRLLDGSPWTLVAGEGRPAGVGAITTCGTVEAAGQSIQVCSAWGNLEAGGTNLIAAVTDGTTYSATIDGLAAGTAKAEVLVSGGKSFAVFTIGIDERPRNVKFYDGDGAVVATIPIGSDAGG